jgi:hypothetical protein
MNYAAAQFFQERDVFGLLGHQRPQPNQFGAFIKRKLFWLDRGEQSVDAVRHVSYRARAALRDPPPRKDPGRHRPSISG